MTQYLIVFVFFLFAILLMLTSLHFSKYKKKSSGCCGGGHCSVDGGDENHTHSCYSEKVEYIDKKISV